MMNQERLMAAFNNYLEFMLKWIVSSGLRVIIIAVFLVIALKSAAWISRQFFNRFKPENSERAKRIQTLETIIGVTWKTLAITLAVMLILGEIGINLGPLIATAGIVGLAVGFGAQELVKDVISGFLILFEDQIRVGDVVELEGKSGLVEKVNLRTIILRDMKGNVHFIRNGNINIVTNMTKDYSYYLFEIGISYNDDVDKAIEVMKQVDENLRSDPDYGHDIIAPLEIFGLDSFASSALIIKARTKTLPVRQWSIGREFNRRLKLAFDNAGIEIPFPHQTLYLRTDAKQTPQVNLGSNLNKFQGKDIESQRDVG